MGKIAVVGCEASGKTVFMASLADYFRAGQRDNQASWLIPENSDAHKFTELRNYEMRVQHAWPAATFATDTISLKWTLREKNGTSTDIEMLEFGGEVFRAAFREEGSSPEHKEAAEKLVTYLIDADFVVVLVSLRELFRGKDDRTVFEKDAESTWVTRGLIDFVKKNLPSQVGLIVALTQADLYRKELEQFGGPAGVLKKQWPMIYALYPDLPVVAVASVSKTTADGRPAEGYTTEGVLPVMKAYSEYLYGSPKDAIECLSRLGNELTNATAVCPIETLDRKLLEHKQCIEALGRQVTIVEALYDDVIAKHTAINLEANAFIGDLRKALTLPIDDIADPNVWSELRSKYPLVEGTINIFGRDAAERHEAFVKERARREEEDRKAHEAEALRIAESEKRDEERRRQLELREKEQQAEEERVRLQRERSKVAARTLAVRVLIVLIALFSIGAGLKFWRDSVAAQRVAKLEKERQAEKARMDRIEAENAVKLAKVRAAEAEAKQLEEKNRADEIARKKVEEENRKKELELRQQAEKQRLIDEENAKKRIELERKKAEEERALEQERRIRLEEENKKRKLEIEREEALRKAEAEKQRKLEEARERERQAEQAAKKLEEDKKDASAMLRRIVQTLNSCLVERSEGLINDLKTKEKLLSTDEKSLFDDIHSCFAVLKSADGGDEAFQKKVGAMFESGTSVITKDEQKAYSWYLKAADSGDPIAQFKVGQMLLSGTGVMSDMMKAHTYFLKAAEQNHPQAQFTVAGMYQDGKGVEEDGDEALKWYRRAAELGNSDAQLALYKKLKNKARIFRNRDEAGDWLEKAADAGNAEACYILGCIYYNGDRDRKMSITKAYKFLMKAKEKGYESKDLDRKLAVCSGVILDRASRF